MHRLTVLGRNLASGLGQTSLKTTTPLTGSFQTRGNAGGPEKIECFVDGKKVLVDPGTTVLQVRKSSYRSFNLLMPSAYDYSVNITHAVNLAGNHSIFNLVDKSNIASTKFNEI